MEIDAMQYASMSRELLRGDNILHLFDNGNAYLDKPPLIFWMTALFFKTFGVSDFVYRLPSLIFSLFTIYSTFQFSLLFYSRNTAKMAALILASCEAFFIMNSDVRTDIYMIAPMMAGIWQLSSYFKYHQLKNLILGSIAISFAMMGKGPIGLVIPAIVISIDLILRNNIHQIFDRNLILGLIVILLFLLPMSYGLFTQFGIYGLEFFYWTQSFGRITGESNWNNNTSPFYLLNVFLYAFLPWTLLFLWAFVERTRNFFNIHSRASNVETISYFGFIIPLIMLSLSNYKLPHYIYCVVPFTSILIASKIEQWHEKYKRIFFIQTGVLVFMLIFVYGIIIYSFSTNIIFFIIPLLIIIGFIRFHLNTSSEVLARLFIPTIAATILFNYGLNLGIIKQILDYQAPFQAAKYILEQDLNYDSLYLYNENEKEKSRSFNYYLDADIEYIDHTYFNSLSFQDSMLIYTDEKGYNELLKLNKRVNILNTFKHTRVSKITIKFLNPNTRSKSLKNKYLLRCI